MDRIKYLPSFFLVCLCATALFAQKDYKGRVIDAATKEPIPYVNIGIVDAGVGTVSDEDGLFHLSLDENLFEPSTPVLFSALGYRSLEIPLRSVPRLFNEYPDIAMQPTILELNEVVVSDKATHFIEDAVGYLNNGQEAYGYWKDNIALGGELATKIVVKKGIRRLDRLSFEVWYNPSDSLLLRVNVYDTDGPAGKPGTNLNKSGHNMLCTVRKDDRFVSLDLKPFDIYVKDDFIVSLELLKIYGESELGLVLAAAGFEHYGSFRKYVSQDKWEKIDSRNMAYKLETSLLVPEKVAQRFEKRKTKKERKQQTVSGFVIFRGKMISKVQVLNNRTKELVVTDEKGRYRIPIRNNDILTFSKDGLKTKHLQIKDKATVNVIMEPHE